MPRVRTAIPGRRQKSRGFGGRRSVGGRARQSRQRLAYSGCRAGAGLGGNRLGVPLAEIVEHHALVSQIGQRQHHVARGDAEEPPVGAGRAPLVAREDFVAIGHAERGDLPGLVGLQQFAGRELPSGGDRRRLVVPACRSVRRPRREDAELRPHRGEGRELRTRVQLPAGVCAGAACGPCVNDDACAGVVCESGACGARGVSRVGVSGPALSGRGPVRWAEWLRAGVPPAT